MHNLIALVTLSVIAELSGYLADSDSLCATGFWALIGAVAGSSFAVIAGLFDMRKKEG